MKIFQTFTAQTGLNRLRASFRSWLSQYVDDQADVFESLTRQATPNGGNCLTSEQASDVAPEPARQQIARPQREVDELGMVIAWLANHLDSLPRSARSSSALTREQSEAESRQATWKKEIGINTDLTAEGPFRSGYGGSFLANYRYSTIGLLSNLGLVTLEGAASTFQDGAFKVFLPTKKWGSISLFRLGRRSGIRLENINPGTWTIPTNETADANIRRDYDKTTYLMNVGLSHTLPLGTNGYVNTTLSLSGNGIDEDVVEWDIFRTSGVQRPDSLANSSWPPGWNTVSELEIGVQLLQQPLQN